MSSPEKRSPTLGKSGDADHICLGRHDQYTSPKLTGQISFARGRDQWDNVPTERVADDFGQFRAQILGDRDPTAYVCTSFETGPHLRDREKYPGEQPFRCADYARPRAWLPMDLDDGHSAEAFAELILAAHRFSGFAYTTRSHTQNQPRARLVFELTRPVTRDESIRLGPLVEDLLTSGMDYPFGWDGSVYKNEQPLFLPGPRGSTYVFEGEPINPDALLPRVKTTKKTKTSASGNRAEWLEQLRTGDSVHDSARAIALSLANQNVPADVARATLDSLISETAKHRDPKRIQRLQTGELADLVDSAYSKVETERAEDIKVDAAAILPPQPEALLNLPGELGALQDYVHGRQTYPDRAMAGMTALAVATCFAQTNVVVKSRQGLGLQQYFQIAAPTGYGKEDIREPLIQLDRMTIERYEQQEPGNLTEYFPPASALIRSASPSSAQGCHMLLEESSSLFLLTDENSHQLLQSRSNPAVQGLIAYLLQAYSRTNGTLEPGNAAGRTYTPVESPRLSLLGTSTPEGLFGAFNRTHGETGFVNRWTLFVADPDLPPKVYDGLVYEPTDELVDFCLWLKQQPPKTEVRFSPEGYETFKALDTEHAEPAKREDAMLGGRLAEQALKIAGLLALGNRRLVMEPEDLEQAFEIRMGLYRRAFTVAEHHGSLSGMDATGHAAELIIRQLRKHPVVYKSRLTWTCRAFGDLKVWERETVLRYLREVGACAPDPESPARLVSLIYQGEQ